MSQASAACADAGGVYAPPRDAAAVARALNYALKHPNSGSAAVAAIRLADVPGSITRKLGTTTRRKLRAFQRANAAKVAKGSSRSRKGSKRG